MGFEWGSSAQEPPKFLGKFLPELPPTLPDAVLEGVDPRLSLEEEGEALLGGGERILRKFLPCDAEPALVE